LSPSVLVEKPKDTIQLKAIAISCQGVQDKGGDGAGSVPDEQPEVLYSLSITVISCQGVWEKGGDGAGFVPDGQPKNNVQLQPYFVQVSETKEVMEQDLFRINSLKIPYIFSATAIFCLGARDKGDDGAGSVPDKQPKDTIQFLC
jgi:hypothetical protein